MAELNYTKGKSGKWRNQAGFIMTDEESNRKPIVKLNFEPCISIDEMIDNASLIAAAPAMYESLKEVYTNLITAGEFDHNSYALKARKQIEAALAAAEGSK